jgi:hypothetical protein
LPVFGRFVRFGTRVKDARVHASNLVVRRV